MLILDVVMVSFNNIEVTGNDARKFLNVRMVIVSFHIPQVFDKINDQFGNRHFVPFREPL